MRKLVLLLAAALALTACTAAPEVSSPAEAAPPAETAAIGEAAAAFPVGTLQMAIPEVMDTGAASVEITFTGLETEPILKLDYATGVQTKLCDIDLSRQIPVAIMQHGDTVEYFWDSEGGTVFAHTAIRPDGSVEEQTIPEKFYPNFYDEYAAYDIWGTTCKRLDWQTGKLTTASLPFVQLDSVPGAVGSRVLLTRIVSDTPLPEGEGNEEMLDAVLQNSLREYDLYDPATNTIEKVFDEPYYPEEHNELRSYLGYCGDKLYFGVTYTDSVAAFSMRMPPLGESSSIKTTLSPCCKSSFLRTATGMVICPLEVMVDTSIFMWCSFSLSLLSLYPLPRKKQVEKQGHSTHSKHFFAELPVGDDGDDSLNHRMITCTGLLGYGEGFA